MGHSTFDKFGKRNILIDRGVYILRSRPKQKTRRGRPMLENALFESQGRKKTRKPVTVLVSVAIHVLILAVLLLIPLLQIQAITVPPPDMSLWLPKAEKPKVVDLVPVPRHAPPAAATNSGAFIAPRSIPADILRIV